MKHPLRANLACYSIFVLLITAAVTIVAAPIVSHDAATTAVATPKATLMDIKGAIGPATEDFIRRGLAQAAASKHRVCILQIDTPGGLSTSMRGIIKAILASPVPVLSFVYPKGARAASAGTYILYASHIAAMAPGTNVGAATPVSINLPAGSNPSKPSSSASKQPSPTMNKAINDAKAYITSLAELRGRNAKWAAKAVTKGDSLSSYTALKYGVINFMAYDINDLLKKADKKQVRVNGALVTLDTKGLQLIKRDPDRRTAFLSTITNPSVAYILLMVGIYGLFFEFLNPGLVIPGVAGGICLLVALYAFQLLPVNYAGVGLLLLGVIFFIAEVFTTSMGVLAVGGIISLVVGSILLFPDKNPHYVLALPKSLIAGVVGFTALFFIGLAQLAYRAHRRTPVNSGKTVVGKQGIIIKRQGKLWVKIGGELWTLHPEQPVVGLRPNTPVKVIDVKGLALYIEPLHPLKQTDKEL